MSRGTIARCGAQAACIGLLALTASAQEPVRAQIDGIDPQYENKNWTLNDLLYQPLDSRPVVRNPVHPGLRGGTEDIGEIAVLEDDGTLVIGGVTDIINIANAFLATHPDDYDALITFVASTFAGDIEPEAGFAFYQGLAGFTAGINSFQGNPNEGGGVTRLAGLINMNDLPEYPADFDADFFGGVASGVEILGQEFEHMFGSFVQSDTGDILGRSNAHWSFFLNHPGGSGNASPMEGNLWQDNGGGSFTTIESFNGLSPLDDYLMGLRPPASVGNFYLITFAGGQPFSDSSFPAVGVNVTGGTRVNMTVQNIINQHGDRLPSTNDSMKVFKVAFLLVIPNGTMASAGDISKIDSFRTDWENYFFNTTDNLGSMDTTLAAGPTTTLPFSDSFNGSAVSQTDWLWVQGGTISDLGIAEPSGSLSLRLNGNWGAGGEIRSRVIDLSGFSSGQVTIDYSVERTGGGNSPEAGEDLLVEYFDNTQGWSVLRTFAGDGPDQSTYAAFSDMLPDNGLHSAFRLRFHRLQGSIGAFDDYFVDDVSINGPGGCPDADGDGVCDPNDVCPGFDDNLDDDGDGVPNGCDICFGDDNVDTDGDGVPDACDNCPGFDDTLDSDGDGVPNGCDLCPGFDDLTDSDGDGVPNGCDICPGFDDGVDSDGDGVPDGCDICAGFDDNADADGDGVPDGCDVCPAGDDGNDADGDGVPDRCDICAGFDDNADADGDGVPDGCDVCPAGDDGNDADGDGVPDGCDICAGFDDNADSDGDGVPDGCDICPGFDDGVDSDGDGVPDGCDICAGFDDNIDTDGDGVPDGCDCAGDADGDGDTDISDLGLLLANFGAAVPAGTLGDLNGSSSVDITDLGILLADFGCAP
jgi:hypothetical protein